MIEETLSCNQEYRRWKFRAKSLKKRFGNVPRPHGDIWGDGCAVLHLDTSLWG